MPDHFYWQSRALEAAQNLPPTIPVPSQARNASHWLPACVYPLPIFHGLSSNHGADLFFESFDLLVNGAITGGNARFLGSFKPRSFTIHGLSDRPPVDLKSGVKPLSFMTAFRAVGISAMLVTTAPFFENIGLSGV